MITVSAAATAAAWRRISGAIVADRRRSIRARNAGVARRRAARGFRRRRGHYHGNERRNQAPSNRSDSRRLFHNGNDAQRGGRYVLLRRRHKDRRTPADRRHILSEVFCPGTRGHPQKTLT